MLNLYSVKPVDAINGEGLRMSIWFSGCSNGCKGCWSPETWCPTYGKPYTDWLPVIIKTLSEKPLRGVSLLGGDPLYHIMNRTDAKNEVLQFIKLLKSLLKNNQDLWVWTGYLYEDIQKECPEVLNYIDVLVDGKYDEALRDVTLQFRGSSNQRIIDVKQRLEHEQTITT